MSKLLTTLVAGVGALALAGAADAQGRGGGGGAAGGGSPPGGGVGAGAGAGVRAGPSTGGTLQTNPGSTVRDDARANRQGPANAADPALQNANPNAALTPGQAGASASLSALAEGMTVQSSTGTSLGTISRIERSPDGTVRTVLLTRPGANGTVRLDPSTLSITGTTVTTSMTLP
jgi:hypothetical protein